MKPPKPRLRPPPLPRLREMIDRLGTGNRNPMPRLRPQPAGLLARAASPRAPAPQGLLAQVDPALADLPPVGGLMNSPFASRWTEAPPPPSPGGQVAGSVSPSQPGSPPPLQPGDDAMQQELQQAVVDALLRAFSVQPQPDQPAYSDDFSTATQPPAFTSPMGAYR